MFTDKDLIRKELRTTVNGHKYNVGVYLCKSCGKELFKTNQQAKKQCGYCISCKNIKFLTKSRIAPSHRICNKCNIKRCITKFSKRRGLYNLTCIRCLHLFHKYKIYSDTYDSLLKSQNNCCAICKKPEISKTNNRSNLSLSVDHCHTTNKVRGLLCGKCNMALGLLDDAEVLLLSAIKYLKRSR